MAEAIAGKQFPFLWEGRDRKGNRVKGRGLAKDETELRTDLRRQGIAVKKVRKERHLFKSEGKIKGEDIALFSRQLSTMLTAGIPMVQAFEIIGVGHDKPVMQKLVLAIKTDIETGNALNVALAKHPLYFNDLYVNLLAFERDGSNATFSVIIEPLVLWIRVGGFIIAIGGLFSAWPVRRRAPKRVVRAEAVEVA